MIDGWFDNVVRISREDFSVKRRLSQSQKHSGHGAEA